MGRKESLSITVIYQSAGKYVMYGYCDAPYGDPDALDMIHKWVELHSHVFTEQEVKNLCMSEMSFLTLQSKEKFMERTDFLLGIHYYRGQERFPMTGYEQNIYEEILYSWYDLYKTVVVAGQILPSVLFCTDDYGKQTVHGHNMNDIMQKLGRVSNSMYEQVDEYDKFLDYLSTTHITNTLIMHPLVTMRECSDEKDTWELFKYQMFKDDKKKERYEE